MLHISPPHSLHYYYYYYYYYYLAPTEKKTGGATERREGKKKRENIRSTREGNTHITHNRKLISEKL